MSHVPAENEDPVLSVAQYARLLAASAKGRMIRARASSSNIRTCIVLRGLHRCQSQTAMDDCTLSPTQIHPTPGGLCRGRCRNQNGTRLKSKIRCVGIVPTGGCGFDHPCDARFGEREEQEETVDGRRRSDCLLNPPPS